MLEQAVLLSVRLKDEAAVERNFTQLKTYYTDTRRGRPGLWLRCSLCTLVSAL